MNIVDDDPAPVAEWLPHLADAVGAKPPMTLPTWLAPDKLHHLGPVADVRALMSELRSRPE